MNPRMRENGIRIQPENEFQIRNPWIPPTPDQNLSRSNGISIDQNDNRLRRRNRSELLNLLNRPSEQTSNYNKVGGNSNFPGRLNQIGMGNGISTSGDCSNQTVPLNQSSGSYDINHYQMGNRIFTTGGNSNLTLPVNQNSILYDINSSPIGNRVFTTGDCSNLTVPSYQSSGSCDMNNYLMGNGISTSGNSSNFTVPLNQSRGSYDMNNYQIGYGILENGNNFNFDRPMNHISSSKMVDHQMGNGNSGAYLNSQTQSYRNDIASNRGFIGNMVQQPSFSAINNPQIVIPKTDAVISSPLLNMNIRPLSPPRGINTDMNLPNAPSVLNSYSEVDSSWTAGNFTNLLLGDDIVNLGPNRLLRSDNSSQMLGDGYHVRVQHNNLNSTPRHGGNTGTNNASSFQFAPITPDHKNILEMQKQAQMLKFLVDDDSGQEHDKMENLISSIGNEIIENHCSELLQTIENHGSENKMSEERGDQNVIDLNETPKQKTPKRRKHRPKVVIEGKPKRTPKPKTPTNGESEKNPSKKRKYVQKNRDAEVENTPSQPTDVIYMAKVPNFESREESCRRKLNFDFEKSEKGENQHKTHYQSNQPVLDLNLNYPTNELPVKSLAREENRGPANPSEIINYDPLNVIATNVSTRRKKNRENRNLKGELNKKISQPNHNLERTKEMKWKSTHQMVERDVGNFKGFCGTKGEEAPHVEQVGPSSEKNESRSEKVGNSSEETCKKQKMENDSQNMSYGPEKGYPISGTSGENGEQIVPEKKIASISDGVHSTGYFDVVKNSKFHSEITSKKIAASGYQQMTENYQTGMQNNTLNLCREVSFCKHKVPSKEPKDTLHEYPQLSKTARGRPKVFKYSKKMVDEITFRLQSLSISGEKYKKCEYALVPCGGGGAMMLYEPKRRKPRPKVDLDPETDRIWKLLMGKEGAEASKGENRNKEKWWEEERRVFQGRAESFIARMHLVQGNRRFSPWKGSVVDSIIGVFLTQNVSDQLSSSAFMALAAKFPLGVATPDQGSDQSGTSILTEEPEIQKISPYEPIECFDKIINQPIHRQLADPYLGSLGKGKMGIASEHNQIIIEENASTSQNSSTSSIHNINGEIQSYSRSSSEMENSKNGGNPIKINGFTSSQHENRTVPLQVIKYPENESLCFNKRSMLYHKEKSELDYNKQIQGSNSFIDLNSFSLLNRQNGSSIFNMQNSNIPSNFLQLLMTPENAISETDCCEISREEYRSSFPSKAPEINKGNCIKYHNNRVGHKADTMKNSLFQQNGLKNNQTENIDPFGFLRNHPTVEKSSIHQVHQTKPPFLNPHQVERSRISESQHPEFNNITRTNDSGNQVPIISKKHTGQNVGIQEGTKASNNQVFSGETNIETSAKNLKKRQTQEKVKKESFDWDSLRRTLQSNGGKKERNIDASDSMDYEAMRCADVNVISNSIRIRGMNNMLSERIKDFLNRVVTDHGSIDLEWLRDVPPDKAKDYLLSIRGLGLKSVECVRLLTLHHLAFPVDTNVGRIAVRLGWVPLQPLPESLQLHLLEMYPVLETVQKYLWPRLCKLDQKTLYELHYQLITFGKVFCTKSKPNCNACPMRGECRHFASAFASARLALPAPEEKGIMGSTISITTNRIPDMAINPLLLQPSVNNGEREFMVSRCEPIIEEPATPEPEIIELPETDIEDAFYEDPDEIPTIRLNVEQLTVNLRNFMETHTDLRGEDMSKALVALAPEVASIPAPKLKYVLRLRTERQVYVLTDTHPLVKELDKREPDDPSPYLLALLAPGEEAGLDQPSGKCCESNEKECSSVDKEANSLTVRGTLLIPCRTAMRGSFPLNGTYFQVNEVFADHESSLNPINVPRECLWHLETRTVFFGTSATSIFRGMTTKEIQNSFWRGFVCVRGFDRKSRAPRPLNHNLHISQNKRVKKSNPA